MIDLHGILVTYRRNCSLQSIRNLILPHMCYDIKNSSLDFWNVLVRNHFELERIQIQNTSVFVINYKLNSLYYGFTHLPIKLFKQIFK